MRKHIERALGITLLSTLVLLLSGCPPKTVIIDGKEMPVGMAADLTYQDAFQTMQAGDTQAAVTKFEHYIRSYSDAPKIDEALYHIGNLYFQIGEYEKAVTSFQRIMGDYPQSNFYIQAAIQLGTALFKAGRRQEALPTLQSVFDRLPDYRKKAEVSGMLAEAYLKSGSPIDALRWYAVLHELTTIPGAKQAIYEQVIEVIDQHMSFVQVREALEMFVQDKVQGFPTDLLHYKLAKIYYHILDLERSKQTLEEFVSRYPDHPLTQNAVELIGTIMDRARVERNSIGVLLPLSGQLREYGKRALQAIQMGAGVFGQSYLNTQGSAPVLVIRDTAGDPDRAVLQLEELVLKEHVIAVIGPMTANAASAVAVKAEELQVPVVTLSKKKDITKIGPYVFRNFLTLNAQAKLLVSHAMRKLGATKFAVLYPNDSYGVEFTNAFWDEVDQQGGEMRAAERYEPDTKNFSSYIKKMVGRYHLEAREDFQEERQRIRKEIKDPLARDRAMSKLLKTLKPIVDFQAIFVPDYVDNAVLIAPGLAFEDVILKTESRHKIDQVKKSLGQEELDMVYLLGGNGWNSPRLIEWARRYVQGAIFCDAFFPRSNRPATKRFMSEYEKNFEQTPSAIEAEAYDTALIMKNIIQQSAPQDRDSMRRALLNTKNFPGASGDTSFLPDGDVEKTLFLLTVQGEEIIELDQKAYTDASS